MMRPGGVRPTDAVKWPGVRRAAWAAAAAAWILGVPLPVAAADAEGVCMTCHGEPALARSRPGGRGSLHVDPKHLAASVHGDLGCADCHRNAQAIPHPARLERVRCASCHAAAGESVARGAHAQRNGRATPDCVGCHGGHAVQPAASFSTDACGTCHTAQTDGFGAGVHGMALAHGDPQAATCRDCHGPAHEVIPHRDAESPVSHARLAETCARCHADQEIMGRRKIAIPEAYALYARSVHGRSDSPDAATCTDCHESHRLLRASDPGSSIYRTNIPTTCGRCHVAEARAYEIGIHGDALRRGVVRAPVCTDCHGEHRIRGPHELGSPVAAAAVTTTCARCHEAEGIRETYGLPAGRLDTYRDSYHGLAARGGSPVVAHCASCHGYHDILPSSDLRSAVSPERLPETCGKCHPGAGPRFASGPVHVAMARPQNPVLYTVRWVYLVLIVVTIGGMVLHNGLDFAAKLWRHWRRFGGVGRSAVPEDGGALEPHEYPEISAAGRWHERMTLSERIQHGLLALSFFTLVYTGFALRFPESWLFGWLARLEEGYAWRSLIHRVAAVVMVATALFHVGYLVTRRGRGVLAALRLQPRDGWELGENILHMLGRRARPPDFDRFGYVEKAEYWALVWGTVIMTLTGVVLWFENQALQWLDKWMLDLATLIHYYEAWLAFLAIVVWHIYHTMFNPDVYPMNWTWLTGRISAEQLRHEHPAEWARLAAAAAATEGSKPDAEEAPPPGGDPDETSGLEPTDLRDQHTDQGEDRDQ